MAELEVDMHKAAAEYVWRIRVRSQGLLDYCIKDYFSGLTASDQKHGSTIISGVLPDLPAVYGLILQLRDTGMVLLYLKAERVSCKQ